MSCEVERLGAAWLSADAERERQETTLKQLQHVLSREGSEMNCAYYMEVQARIAQQRQRFDATQAKAATALVALDEARSREADREQREIAQRQYDSKLNELENAKVNLAMHREQIAVMNRDTPLLEREFNLALAALDHAKGAL